MPVPPGVPVPSEVRSEVYTLAPNRMYMKLEMPGMGLTEIGYDGTTAWSNSTATGAMILPDVPKELAEMSDFGAPDLRKMKSIYGGIRELDGEKHDVVHSTLPDSQKITAYYSRTSGLMTRMKFQSKPPVIMTYHDYRRFDGVLFATRHVTGVKDVGEIVVRVVSIDHKPIDPKMFAPPANAVKHRD